jgi:hypothetical protein
LSQQWLFLFIFFRTEVTKNHAILVFEKLPGGKFHKIFLKGGRTMLIILSFLAGIIIGFLIFKVTSRPKISGTIRVDQSDPDAEPYLFLELQNGVGTSIMQKKYVTFEVSIKDYIPHK